MPQQRRKYYIDPVKIASLIFILTEVEVIINTQLDLAKKGELHSKDNCIFDYRLHALMNLQVSGSKEKMQNPLCLRFSSKLDLSLKDCD